MDLHCEAAPMQQFSEEEKRVRNVITDKKALIFKSNSLFSFHFIIPKYFDLLNAGNHIIHIFHALQAAARMFWLSDLSE